MVVKCISLDNLELISEVGCFLIVGPFLVYIAIGSVRDNVRDKIPLEVKEEEDSSSNTVEQQIWLLAVLRSFLFVP